MTGFKEGTGSLDFEEEMDEDESGDTQEAEREQITDEAEAASQSTTHEQDQEVAPTPEPEIDAEPQAESAGGAGTTPITSPGSQSAEIDMEDFPYLVQRQMRGAPVNVDRANQLLLEVREFVKENEDSFLDDLEELVNGPVYKSDAREAALIVAQENPELVAEKLREWGIEHLDA